ncbi:MAG: hypothetical protein O3A27_06150 [Actinomycetota bacterium]|nr:hypothetical protein [Actinomycetota bacterium]
MSTKKRFTAVVITVAALSVGSIGVATAQDLTGKAAERATVLAELVKAGTITQAKADAITKKFDSAKAARDANRSAHKAGMKAHHEAAKALIASTIGVDAATIKTRRAAGESLASIAGAKKDALIQALVAFNTKEIDARVSAGKLSAARATTIKANLQALVTAKIESVKGPKAMGPKAMAPKAMAPKAMAPKAMGPKAMGGKGKRH